MKPQCLLMVAGLAAVCGCGPKLSEAERKAGKPASANFETHRVQPPPGYDPTQKPPALLEKLARKAKAADGVKPSNPTR